MRKKFGSSGVGGWVDVPHLIHPQPMYGIILYIILFLICTGSSMGTGYLTLGPVLIDRHPHTHAWFNNTITRLCAVTIGIIYNIYICCYMCSKHSIFFFTRNLCRFIFNSPPGGDGRGPSIGDDLKRNTAFLKIRISDAKKKRSTYLSIIVHRLSKV